MGNILGKIRALVAVVLACSVSSLPSCSAMGGGMRHLIECRRPPRERCRRSTCL